MRKSKCKRFEKMTATGLLLAVMILCTAASCGDRNDDNHGKSDDSVQEVTITTNGNGGKTDVGVWFTTYNVEHFWEHRFGGPNAFAVGYRSLLADGSYGIPESGSIEEIDFQIEKMAEAGIDFILFDLTNGGLSYKFNYGTNGGLAFIIDNAKLTCERLAVWNEAHSWKIRYAVGIGTYEALRNSHVSETQASYGLAIEEQAKSVKQHFLDDDVYGKYYYEIDGKPLLVLHNLSQGNPMTDEGGYDSYTGDKKYSSRFSLRVSNSFADRGGPNNWSWLTRDTEQPASTGGTMVGDEVTVVCPGQWNHADSAPNASRDDGKHYKANWDTVIRMESKPRVVLISSLNDYMEDTAIWPSDTSACTVEEKWYNYEDGRTDTTAEGRNTDADMYWNMTVNYIEQLRELNGDTVPDSNARVTAE